MPPLAEPPRSSGNPQKKNYRCGSRSVMIEKTPSLPGGGPAGAGGRMASGRPAPPAGGDT
jgi:hypothetical protein